MFTNVLSSRNIFAYTSLNINVASEWNILTKFMLPTMTSVAILCDAISFNFLNKSLLRLTTEIIYPKKKWLFK